MGCWDLVERQKGIGCGGQPRLTKKAPAITPPGLKESVNMRTEGNMPRGRAIRIVAVVQYRALLQ